MLTAAMPLTVEEPDPPTHLGRLWFLVAGTLFLLLGLAVRLWVLQAARYENYELLASQNRVRLEPTEAPRAGIFDRDGVLLAGNRVAARIAVLGLADPQRQMADAAGQSARFDQLVPVADLPQPALADQLQLLRELLALTPADLARIQAELDDPKRPKFTPVVVAEEVAGARLTAVSERLWLLPNVVIEKVPLRHYPLGPVTAHIVGYVGSISPSELTERRAHQDEEIAALSQQITEAQRTFRNDQMPLLETMKERLQILKRLRSHAASIVGKTGLEAQYERPLKGEPGIRTWQVNARNAPVKLLSTTTGQPGSTLVLNLDAGLQAIAAERLGARRGSAVALDPRDGAVLALYGSPSYDANLFIPRIKPDDWDRILDNPAHPLQNRAIRNSYPPGSTFKMVTSAAGLEAGAITPRFGVSCPGGLRVGSMFKRCWATHGGGIDLTRAMAVSCDTFYYRAALKMGPEALRRTAAEFGIGQPTGIDLPNEHSGRLPSEDWHRAHHRRDWYPGDTANIAIGQGDIATTSLQMALVTATVANGGAVYAPRLVREIRSRDGKLIQGWQPRPVRRVDLAPEQFRKIRVGMRAAVTGGTARVAELPGIPVAGKTGSAEDPPRRLPHAWFVCFAPYENPEIAVAVMVENAGHGGENSGPIAKALLEAYFRKQGRLE